MHIDDPAAVGRRVTEARERAGLTRKDLAFPGCGVSYISRIEAGQRVPSLQVLQEIGRRLGVPADQLAKGTEATAVDDALTRAEMALRFDDPESSRSQFEEIAASTTVPEERARAIAGLGHVAFDQGRHDDAIEHFSQAIELWPGLRDDAAIADSLGRAFALTSRYEEAIAIFEPRLAAAEARDDVLEIVRFSVLLANTLTDRGSFGRAEELIGHVLALTEESRDPMLRARVWWTQARLHILQNDPTRAERYFHLALSSIELTEHARYAAAAHQTLAHIRLDQGKPDEALALLETSLPLVSETGNRFQLALLRTEQARALVELGRLDEAEESAREAIELFDGSSPADAGRATATLGEIHARRGETDEAIAAYRRAVESTPWAARFRLEHVKRLAELLRSVGRGDEALDLVIDAVDAQVAALRS